MNPMQTDDTTINSSSKPTPFDQIKELERRENERVEKELSAMQKEKVEVSQSVSQKNQEAQEALRMQAKKELKEYSEKELTSIISEAQKEAEKEEEKLEAAYTGKKDAAVKMLVQQAKDPNSLFLAA